MNTMVALAKNQDIAAYYDAQPYQSFCFAQTAPETLEAIASLFALKPQSSERARVLELGCASGGNLLPFAQRNPRAQVVGVDISSVHIAQANATLHKMQLNNVRFEQKDLSDITPAYGTFDYIICHGVYSWVPEEVQQAIMRIASQCLAKNGVAYISYNTYPGWKSREIIRDAMKFRGGIRDPEERLRFARGMIDFMHKVAKPHSALKAALDETKPLIDSAASYYLVHEYLEPYNNPVYFTDFVKAAKAHSLIYLADTSLPSMFASNFGSDIAEPLLKECADSQVTLEQYLDFITNRPFRQTLLVVQNQASEIKYRLDAERFKRFHYAGFFEVDGDKRQPGDPANMAYFNSLIGPINITGVVGTAIAKLFDAAWPSTLSFDTLLNELVRETKIDKEQCRHALLGFVEEGIIKGYLRFRTKPVECAQSLSERPQVDPTLRKLLLQTEVTAPISVWNDWHEPVTLSAFEVMIARRLDGSIKSQHIISQIVAVIDGFDHLSVDERQAADDFKQGGGDPKTVVTRVLKRFLRTGLLVKS